MLLPIQNETEYISNHISKFILYQLDNNHISSAGMEHLCKA